MTLQEYLKVSKEELEFILENAELKELESLYSCLDSANGPFLKRKIFIEGLLVGLIREKYLKEFNLRKQNMQNKA